LNDKELFNGTMTSGDKQVVFDISTRNTDKLKLTYSWEETSFIKNALEARVQYNEPDVDANAVDAKLKLDWDFRYDKIIKLEAQDNIMNKLLVLNSENGSPSLEFYI